MKNLQILGTILIVLVVVAVGLVVAFSYIRNQVEVADGDTKFRCQVTLDSDVWSNTDIDGVDCDVLGTCSWLDNQGFILGFFEDSGTIKFIGDDGNTYARTTYSLSDLSTKTEKFTLSGCTRTLKGEIIVDSTEDGRQDSREVVLG